MAAVINIDGTQRKVDTTDMPMAERLALFQSIIGGYVEAVPVKDGGFLLFHEEGKILNLCRNEAATELVGDFLLSDDYIAGTAIHVSRGELDEEAPSNPTRLSPAKDGVVILVVDREREV